MTGHNTLPKTYLPLDNPQKPAPIEVRRSIRPVIIEYLGFDHEIRQGVIEMDEELAADTTAFFEQALELGFPIERVGLSSESEFEWDDDRLMAANVSSGYNFRYIAGTDRISLHAGRAFDINPRQNPYVRYINGQAVVAPTGAVWDLSAPGTLHPTHPLVLLMEERGWEWGGHWTPESGRTDYQHFQKPQAV